jgi:hypothetical protein
MKGGEKSMATIALQLLDRPPLTTTLPASAAHTALDPEGIEFVGETDTLLTMCSCAASSSSPYQG